MAQSLLDGEDDPAIVVNEGGKSPYVLVCEHAGNRIPQKLGTLGLSGADLERHIAWDIGAEQVSRVLSRLLDATLVMQRYSRLVYDCNRPPEAADAIPVMSETTAIPGNASLSPADRFARLSEICRPFHEAVTRVLDQRAAYGVAAKLVTIHSFTKVYKGKTRDVQLGFLHDRDSYLGGRLVKSFPGVDARLNEPYAPKDGVLHTVNLHAAPRGIKSVMIEIRNDLISNERGQNEWAQRLSVPLIQAAN
ncbi:MAG: N-formylglutamate amidohydrolase [Aestuariivirga sp.]